MIVKKYWETRKLSNEPGKVILRTWRGWFLFGFFPLLIEQHNPNQLLSEF